MSIVLLLYSLSVRAAGAEAPLNDKGRFACVLPRAEGVIEREFRGPDALLFGVADACNMYLGFERKTGLFGRNGTSRLT